MFENKTEQEVRQEILAPVEEYAERFREEKRNFHPDDRISYVSCVYNYKEMVSATDTALEFWLTSGRYTDLFKKKLGAYLGVPLVSLVSSGSSANLLAFTVLTSPKLGERRVCRSDEIITVACGFPTTVTPMLQYRAVPVFVDVTIPQYNIDVTKLEAAYSPKTRAAMIAHILGNPSDLKAVRQFYDAHGLWLIEDNCDALGSRYTLDGATQFMGTVSDIGTSSFYPSHHTTIGEGGVVYTKNTALHNILRFMRDWGRGCRCPPGVDNLCGHHFDGQYGELPKGYDYKYVYSKFGFNLKATDLQASINYTQLEKFPHFVERRKENFKRLRAALASVADKLILPEVCENVDPSRFGFLLTCREGASREKLVRYTESKGVQTRMFFAGNLTEHPCFDTLRASGKDYRTVGELTETDRIIHDILWVSVYLGTTDKMIDYMATVIREGLAG